MTNAVRSPLSLSLPSLLPSSSSTSSSLIDRSTSRAPSRSFSHAQNILGNSSSSSSDHGKSVHPGNERGSRRPNLHPLPAQRGSSVSGYHVPSIHLELLLQVVSVGGRGSGGSAGVHLGSSRESERERARESSFPSFSLFVLVPSSPSKLRAHISVPYSGQALRNPLRPPRNPHPPPRLPPRTLVLSHFHFPFPSPPPTPIVLLLPSHPTTRTSSPHPPSPKSDVPQPSNSSETQGIRRRTLPASRRSGFTVLVVEREGTDSGDLFRGGLACVCGGEFECGDAFGDEERVWEGERFFRLRRVSSNFLQQVLSSFELRLLTSVATTSAVPSAAPSGIAPLVRPLLPSFPALSVIVPLSLSSSLTFTLELILTFRLPQLIKNDTGTERICSFVTTLTSLTASRTTSEEEEEATSVV